MQVVDLFLANDERSLVDFRIGFLRKHVSKTYICEASHTFSGAPKEPVFQSIYQDSTKVTVVRIDIPEEVRQKNDRWAIEEFQRDEFLRIVARAHPDDALLFCDADEIPSPLQIMEVINTLESDPNGVLGLVMPVYYRKANWLLLGETEKWHKAKAFLGSSSRDGIRYQDTTRSSHKDGCHLSYLGMQAGEIGTKYRNFSHSELDNPRFSSTDFLAFADEFVISHIGLFYTWGFGLLKVVPESKLPEVSKNAIEARRSWVGHRPKRMLLQRLTASRILSDYMRLVSSSPKINNYNFSRKFSLLDHLNTLKACQKILRDRLIIDRKINN